MNEPKKEKTPLAGEAARGANQDAALNLPSTSDYVASKAQVAWSVKHHRRTSQIQILKECLQRHPNEWLAAPYLAELCGSLAIHSRIADLRRKYGMVIENRLRHEDRGGEIVPMSRYRYRPDLVYDNHYCDVPNSETETP